MNSLEYEMYDLLKSLKEEYGVFEIKAEYENEGSRQTELMRLKDLTEKLDLPIIIKIQVTTWSITHNVLITATLSAFFLSLKAFSPNALLQISQNILSFNRFSTYHVLQNISLIVVDHLCVYHIKRFEVRF